MGTWGTLLMVTVCVVTFALLPLLVAAYGGWALALLTGVISVMLLAQYKAKGN